MASVSRRIVRNIRENQGGRRGRGHGSQGGGAAEPQPEVLSEAQPAMSKVRSMLARLLAFGGLK